MDIYEPTGRAREYSPLALNYFKGCDHGCKYCYVPGLLSRFNSNYRHEIVSCGDSFSKLETSARKLRGVNKQILLSFTGDPYCNYENGQTRKVLSILNRYGHKVAILTKNPAKACKDLDIISQFGDRIKIGTTLTCDNDADSLKWEPGADYPIRRVKALEYFAKMGVKTWASFEPVLYPDQAINLLSQVILFVDHVKIGKLNNHPLEKTIDWPLFLQRCHALLRERGMTNRFYIKKNLLAFNKGLEFTEHETNSNYLDL